MNFKKKISYLIILSIFRFILFFKVQVLIHKFIESVLNFLILLQYYVMINIILFLNNVFYFFFYIMHKSVFSIICNIEIFNSFAKLLNFLRRLKFFSYDFFQNFFLRANRISLWILIKFFPLLLFLLNCDFFLLQCMLLSA